MNNITDQDSTDLGFTLYGPIPILIPQRIKEDFTNFIADYKVEAGIHPDFWVARADKHEITIEGYLAGRFKSFFKKALIMIRDQQVGLSKEKSVSKLEYPDRFFALPFVTDMSFEIDMLIESLEFTHDSLEFKEAYKIKLTLLKKSIYTDWKSHLIKSAIRAGILLHAPLIRAVTNFVSELNFSSFKESDLETNRDLDGGWSIPLIPTIDPSPRSTSEIAEIPEGIEKKDYSSAPNIEIGFDTSKSWYKLPILKGSQYPQHWKLQSGSDVYEIILQIIPLKDEKYLKMRVKKDDEVIFSQRVTQGIVYKVDKNRTEEGEVYYKFWFGFTKLKPILTRSYAKGESSLINGVVHFAE